MKIELKTLENAIEIAKCKISSKYADHIYAVLTLVLEDILNYCKENSKEHK